MISFSVKTDNSHLLSSDHQWMIGHKVNDLILPNPMSARE